jgi:hypothetical protein
VSALVRDQHYLITDEHEARQKTQDKRGCGELLKRLIEHHPSQPIGVCREPSTKKPLVNYRRDDY